MDDEITNLADVKSFDPADYATAAQGSTADSALQSVVDDTTPQLGGDLDLNGNNIDVGEDASITIDPSLSADAKYSGITITGTGGATIAVGDVIYLDATAGEWLLADASAAATAGPVPIGIAVSTSTDGNPVTVLLNGTVRAATFPASIALGAAVYISETEGDLTATAPTTASAIVRVLGWAVTTEPNTIYFNPTPSWVEIA